MPADRIILVPAGGPGEGTGHKRRCGRLAEELGSRAQVINEAEPGEPDGPRRTTADHGEGFLDTLAVFDRRKSRIADLLPWVDSAAPLLLDDDGTARRIAPYLIDIIPGPRSTTANVSNPNWLDLPERTRTPDASGDILVTFGGEDRAGLTVPVLRFLLETFAGNRRIAATSPDPTHEELIPSGVDMLREPRNLKSRLGEFGLVLTSYGLTAWEALSAGCAVITADPTPYHAELSAYSGLPGIGRVGPINHGRLPRRAAERLRTLMSHPDLVNEKAMMTAIPRRPGGPALAEFLAGMEAPRPRCAACGSPLPDIIARFPSRSYYRCPDCRMIGLYRFRLKNDEYGSSYFQEEYRRQYGRSYLEDFPAIEAMARDRLDIIGRKALESATLLDVGCAFGPFLKAAAEAGYRCHGTDVSEEGVSYVQDTLGLPAAVARFPDENPADLFDLKTFDVVTMWYVIEHFPDLERVLEVLSRVLSRGGVLALSTPNGSGISGRRSLREFLERSPADHYTIWTPSIARKLLLRHGFRVYRIRNTGHHPERFRLGLKEGSVVFRMVGLLSRLFSLGDTFEVYAVKEEVHGRPG